MKRFRKVFELFLTVVIGAVFGAVFTKALVRLWYKEKEKPLIRLSINNRILLRWLYYKQINRSILEYFENNNFNRIAIYGAGDLGKLLYHELFCSGVNVVCMIDKNAEYLSADCPVLGLEDIIPEVDVIVVTVAYSFDIIREDMRKKVSCPIVSLEDIIFDGYFINEI